MVNGARIAQLFIFGDDGPLSTAVGFDAATGLGTPSRRYLDTFGLR
jgi:hypothetical protein